MGEDPEVIRREIEEQRDRLGETVDALSYKADVKTRASDAVTGKVTSVKEKIGGAVPSPSMPSTPDVDVAGTARRAGGLAQENPLGLAIGAAAVGFLAGLLIPATAVENQKIGPVADQIKDKVSEVGSEAVQHGKEVAQEVAQSAQETAKEAGQEHAGRFQESAQDKAQDVKENVGS